MTNSQIKDRIMSELENLTESLSKPDYLEVLQEVRDDCGFRAEAVEQELEDDK